MTEILIKQRLKKIRKSKGLTQEQVADLLKVKTLTYRRLETGKAPIINPYIRELADLFDIKVEEIICSKIDHSSNIAEIIADIIDENRVMKQILKKHEEEGYGLRK